jgi:hypothetical protein
MYLWCQVEPQEAVVGELVFHEKGYFVGEAQVDLPAQAGCFAEVDQVFQREGEVYGFGEGDFDVQVGLVHVCVLAQCHGTIANVSIRCEFDTLFCAFDTHCKK